MLEVGCQRSLLNKGERRGWGQGAGGGSRGGGGGGGGEGGVGAAGTGAVGGGGAGARETGGGGDSRNRRMREDTPPQESQTTKEKGVCEFEQCNVFQCQITVFLIGLQIQYSTVILHY